MTIEVIERIARAHRAYSARRVPSDALRGLRRDLVPRAGDLVLARVERLGQQHRLHLPDGRRRQLFAGDEVIVAYGDRYAPNVYEARVPAGLGACHLVASGGLAALVELEHATLPRRPTELAPVGLLTASADGTALNVADFALAAQMAPLLVPAGGLPTTIVVAGSSMDSGKTTALAQLTHGLRGLGLRVGYAKVTGTAAAGDPWLLRDAGAEPVLDFTDAGHASTYRVAPAELERVTALLLRQLHTSGVDVALLEVADGLLQPETAALLASARLRSAVDGVLYAAVDSLGAVHGTKLLAEQGYRLLGVTGMVSSAPLLVREAQAATGLPVFGRDELGDPGVAARLVAEARRAPARAANGAAVVPPKLARPVRRARAVGRVLKRRAEGTAGLDYFAYVPAAVAPDAKLLVAVHGYSRNAREQIEWFAPLCEEAGVVLAAPCFTRERFADYQRLGRGAGAARADVACDEMLGDLRASLGLLLGELTLFGFSGGGQFVHRYALARARRVTGAIVAAPGWYTFPDRAQRFPYGIASGRSRGGWRADLHAFLQLPLLVAVGERDDETDAPNLRRSAALDHAQGRSRRERGLRWVEAMREAAREAGLAQRVQFAELAGVGHSFADCMRAGLGALVLEQMGEARASAAHAPAAIVAPRGSLVRN